MTTSRRCHMAVTAILIAVVAAPLAGPPRSAAEDRAGHEVVIRAAALDPAVLRVTLDERVTFSNRSGRIVHVEFLGDGGLHHVFQVPGSIWAEFHRPGRHPYVIHFSGGTPAEIAGHVDVDDAPTQSTLPRECDGRLTVDAVCITR